METRGEAEIKIDREIRPCEHGCRRPRKEGDARTVEVVDLGERTQGTSQEGAPRSS